jgi:hypothetical protein
MTLTWPFIHWFSRRGGALVAIGATLAAGGIVAGGVFQPHIPVIPGGGGSGDAVIWVAPSGNDATCAKGNQTLPCLSLDKARDIATCGDIIDVAAGNYGSQNITNATSCALSNEVEYINVAGTAQFTSISISAVGVIFDHFRIMSELTMASRLTVRNSYVFHGISASSGQDDWTVDASELDGDLNVDNQEIGGTSTSNYGERWVIRDSNIHGFYFSPNPSVHSEAFYIQRYAQHGLIEGNDFYDNGTTANLFFTWWDVNQQAAYPFDMCVRNNTFQATRSFYDIDMRYQEMNPITQQIKVDPTSNNFDGGVIDDRMLADC